MSAHVWLRTVLHGSRAEFYGILRTTYSSVLTSYLSVRTTCGALWSRIRTSVRSSCGALTESEPHATYGAPPSAQNQPTELLACTAGGR